MIVTVNLLKLCAILRMCVFGWTEVNYWTIIWKPELETTASAFSLDKDITEMLCLIQE